MLDSDALIVAEPNAFELAAGKVAAVRPVDLKGMSTSGPGDPNDAYWQRLCVCCGVEYESLPRVTTTIDEQWVKANYNGGLVVVRAGSRHLRSLVGALPRLDAKRPATLA